ncbi:MAG: winged helix-turn-helix domain-containing protein [Asgard group archaeon]
MRKNTNPRTRWKIILDILQVISEENGAKKTYIMQGGHLDWRNFQKHFNFLLEHGFIKYAEGENCYYLTEEGRNLKNRLKELADVIDR